MANAIIDVNQKDIWWSAKDTCCNKMYEIGNLSLTLMYAGIYAAKDISKLFN